MALRLPPPLAVALLVLAACAHAPPSPLSRLEEAGRAAQGGHPDARTAALAGFDAYLVAGDVTRARSLFAAALKEDDGEPYALMGELLLARHDGHPERALDLALTLLARAPHHPLASAAARVVGESSGASIALDDLILARAREALAKGLEGDSGLLLRGAVGSIQAARAAPERAATFAAMGTPDVVTLLGPFSPYQLLDFDQPTPPEATGRVEGLKGPFGPLVPRALPFADGRWSLSGEGVLGDMYVFAFDLDAPTGGLHVVRAAAGAPFKLYLDQELLAERRSFEHTASTVAARGVELAPGRHRVVLKVAKEERTPSITVSVFREDGRRADLKLAPASGPPPGRGQFTTADAPLVFPRAADLQAALAPEAGEGLATYLAVRDGIGRDRDGSKALLAALGALPKAPAWASLRAELALGDPTLPSKVARGRATRDLELALDGDKADIPSLLSRATLALDESRSQEALELVKQARAAYTPPGYPVLALEARVDLVLGVDAQADLLAKEALKAQAGLCEALTLRYDLAMRRDAVAEADALVQRLSGCASELTRAPEHAKARGQLTEAKAGYERLVAREPTQVGLVNALVGVDVALKRYDDALAALDRLERSWPRNPAIAKRKAEMLALAGRRKEALAEQEHALALDGADLPLRREVERKKTGKELLQDFAISGEEAIRAYEAHPGEESAASAYVLDAAAVRAYPDGSMVDRIHIIQKVLDQSGVSEAAEVNLPQGAQVLALRTRKADGTVLEPENIEGKESISLPGVAVGDYVEYEYLAAHGPRGPAEPGFTAASFYYQIARIPDHWCTYTVVAPKGMGMGVEAHHMAVQPPEARGDDEVFSHEEHNMPPFIPEPNAPPSPNEYLPFVTVGAGATGLEGLVALYADGYADRGVLTFEVEEFARKAAAGKAGKDAVKAIYEAVMQKVSGRDTGLTQGAASTVAQGRGSRLWLLKASLRAVGIPARLALVRTFATDPAPYRYPNEALLPYVCVRAEVPGGPVWMDPVVRYGPFGTLPEPASGGRDAYLLPEPGHPVEKTQTPKGEPPRGRKSSLSLALAADGRLTGSVEELYVGDEAAQLAEGLESMPPTERNQALQSGLARFFPGAELTQVSVDIQHAVGAPLKLGYRFTAPGFARVEGAQLTLPTITFPAHLGRRYVQVSRRQTPLFIEGTEASDTRVELTVPHGYRLSSPLEEVRRNTPYGSYYRKESQSGDVVSVQERLVVPMQRVAPGAYDNFAQFAGEVDLIQARDLLLEQQGKAKAP